jgi:hypothetical protein
MPLNTTESLKPGGKPKPEPEAADVAEAKARAPKVIEGEKGDPSAQSNTQKAIDAEDKVEVYIPKARGTQTVQINGVNFHVPAGQKVEVAASIAAALKGSGALDLPPDF